MADTNNDDVLSVNSDFERIPNTPMERDTDVESLLDEGQKTPKGLAASQFGNQSEKPAKIDQVAFDALMKKVDMLVVKVDGLSDENYKLSTENSELRTHLVDFQHNKEHEHAEFKLVNNSEGAHWDTSVSFLGVCNFMVKNENRGVSIRSTQGFSTVPFFAGSLIYIVNNYEITIDKMLAGGTIHFGFATRDFSMDEWVGKSVNSFAITNDGTLWQSGEETTNFAPGKLSVGNTVSCVIMVGSKTASAEAVNCKRCLEKPSWLFFAKNGKIWGTPIPLPLDLSSTTFFPTISLSAGCEVTANFGANQFKYAPSAAGLNLNCFGGFCHCGQLINELEKFRVQQEILVNNTENAVWNLVNSRIFSVSGNSVTRQSTSSRSIFDNGHTICSKRGFSTESISGSSNSSKVHLFFHYFEITIDSANSDIRIGLAHEDYPVYNYVGSRANSFAIDSDGRFYQSGESKDDFIPDGFDEDDTIGCGLMAFKGEYTQNLRWIFFTKNGKIWGTPVALPLDVPSMLYPTISIYQWRDKVTFNFGNEPFKYAIPPAEGLLC